MIVVGEMGGGGGRGREEESKRQVACFCSGVLCHSFLQRGGWVGGVRVTWCSLICYINADLHSPPVCSHQLYPATTCWRKLLRVTLAAAKEICGDVHSSLMRRPLQHSATAAKPSQLPLTSQRRNNKHRSVLMLYLLYLTFNTNYNHNLMNI